MMHLKQTIGLRVRAARRAEKLSQEQLSERIQRSTETVSNIERAVTLPSLETLERLSRVLKLPMAEFLEDYHHSVRDRKRLRIEMDIRQCLAQLSPAQLEIARIQLQALLMMDKDNQ